MNIPRKSFRNVLTAVMVLFGLYAATGTVYAQQSGDKAKAGDKPVSAEKSGASSRSGKEDGQMIVEVPVVIMVPLEVSDKLALEKGCWVKLYDKKNFEGNSLLLVGPMNLARMIGPFGVNWENKVRSLETGPNTNVTIFDDRNFKDEDKFVDPSKKIPNLSRKMGFFDDFRSLILNCI